MKRNLDADEIAVWKLYSYYALDPTDQVQLIGYSREWFAEDNEPEKCGRNFLIGLSISMIKLNGLFECRTEEIEVMAKELVSFLQKKLVDKQDDFFCALNIPNSEDWKFIRLLSRQILALSEFEIANFRKPLDIESYIEVDGYVVVPKKKALSKK